jgi:iron complex outermembrane receptor protein
MSIKRLALASAIAALPFSVSADEARMPAVVVHGDADEHPVPARVPADSLRRMTPATSDSASLLRAVPGVSVNTAGGVSGLPAIRGLADDRLRIKVDGMDLIAACPNHMNPALSYMDPSALGSLRVYAGITPVSLGGDSIGGTILADSPAPLFAAPGQAPLVTGEVGGYYRSNGDAAGANLSATYATESLSVNYTDAVASSNDYRAAKDFKTTTATGRSDRQLDLDEVGSTAYKTRNQSLGIAWRNADHLVEARVSQQDVPYELYPNQRMDMLDNDATRFNLRYVGQFGWGMLEARAYHEQVDHYMNFGEDKQLAYPNNAVNGMPMYTEAETVGASLKATIDLNPQDLVRIGGELQQYRLDDWWPPSGTGGMSPGTFININDGQRDRLAAFAEWEAKPAPQWTTLLGVRYERVSMDAGEVNGYAPVNNVGMMMNYQLRDSTAFNAQDRAQTDNNWDFTALAKYTVDPSLDIEAGLARKVRSPGVYERYTWSTWPMAAVMNNFVGDGNGYVGDVNLEPEKALTVSATFDWHATDRSWELKATPFFTRVQDYIDAIQWDRAANQPAATDATGQFVVLKYTNQDARLMGIDLSGHMPLAKTAAGSWGLEGLLNYTRGKNLDTGDGLYNVMPLNATVTLTHQLGGWDNRAELVMVRRKDDLSAVRNELETGGYALVHLRGSYSWDAVRLDFGVENLFDKDYQLPTGGAYAGQGMTMSFTNMPWGIAVPGPARSLYAGVTVKF